jgi:hypothetical protein
VPLVTNALALHTANALDAFLDIANGTLICLSTRRNGASKEQFQLRRKFGICQPSALMRQIGWVEEGRISGSS